jgi:DivIVA domain-containing protein
MAITSEDIQNQSFSIERKGYDVDEVDVFLEHVANEIDGMNNLIEQLESQLDSGYSQEEDSFAGFDVPADIEADDAAEPELVEEEQVSNADDVQELEPELVCDEEPDANTAELTARIAELERQLEEKRANDSAISQALIIAQRSADEIIANAKGEAADIIASAKAERERILDKAEVERQKTQTAISQLEDSREEIRNEYQDMLSDFITEASRRLAEIGGTNPVASAHARLKLSQAEPEPAALDAQATNQVPFTEAPVAYSVPAAAGVIPAAATPVASSVEKDFSGFGDADDFEFDELD